MAPARGGYAPNVDTFLDGLKSRPVEASVDSLTSLLKRRQVNGAQACAIATAEILRQVVARDRYSDVDQLLGRVQLVGRKLANAAPHELVIANVIRRVLGLIRSEALEDRSGATGSDPSGTGTGPTPLTSPTDKAVRPPTLSALGSFARTQSIYNLLSDPDTAPTPEWSTGTSPAIISGASTPQVHALNMNDKDFLKDLSDEVCIGIDEIMDEIKQVDEQIQSYAEIIIHPCDCILVHQPSRTVQKFLTRAASKRKFTLFLAVDPTTATTGEDPYASLRKSLTTHGSTVISVLNTGLMAYMQRVNKVILNARAITGNGGVMLDSGAAVIARAAHEMSRKVVVLGGVYKVAPDSTFNSDFIEWGDPSRYVDFSDGTMVKNVKVKNAASEFVTSEFIDEYITNLGSHARDNLHSIVYDHYKDEDVNLDLIGKMQR